MIRAAGITGLQRNERASTEYKRKMQGKLARERDKPGKKEEARGVAPGAFGRQAER